MHTLRCVYPPPRRHTHAPQPPPPTRPHYTRVGVPGRWSLSPSLLTLASSCSGRGPPEYEMKSRNTSTAPGWRGGSNTQQGLQWTATHSSSSSGRRTRCQDMQVSKCMSSVSHMSTCGCVYTCRHASSCATAAVRSCQPCAQWLLKRCTISWQHYNTHSHTRLHAHCASRVCISRTCPLQPQPSPSIPLKASPTV